MRHKLRVTRDSLSRFHTGKSLTDPVKSRPCGDFVTRNYLSIGKYTSK